MQFTDQHNEIRRTVSEFVKKEINPYVEEWGSLIPLRRISSAGTDNLTS
jgi:citronellyl-CoA dehydrogenase